MVYHTDWFVYIEESLHHWNKPNWIIVYELFDVLLNSVCKKAKWLFEEALQIAVKRREVKSKGEKERYKHLMQSSKE